MKAKRILSLLLTVAMISTCVTAFAVAPAGYTEQSVTPGFLSMEGGAITIDEINSALTSPAEMPVLSDVYFDVVATPITDADLESEFGETPASLGLEEDWVDAGYILNQSFYNVGTLSHKKINTTKYGGLKITEANVDYIFDANIKGGVTISSEAFGDENIAGSGALDNGYRFNYSKSSARYAYPTSSPDGTNIEDFGVTIIFVKPGTQATLTLDQVRLVYTYFDTTTGSQAIFSKGTVAPYHKATITLGEAKDDTPAIDEVIGAENTGIAVKEEVGDFKYDNAYAVEVDLTAAVKGNVVGVEFVPAFMSASVDDIWKVAAETTTYSSTWLGEGGATLKAALINIPIELLNETFTIKARAFVKNGADKTYFGTIVDQEVTYTVD